MWKNTIDEIKSRQDKAKKSWTWRPSKVKVKSLSRVWLFATPWTVAYQAPPSMGFSTQEYWSGLPSKYKDWEN